MLAQLLQQTLLEPRVGLLLLRNRRERLENRGEHRELLINRHTGSTGFHWPLHGSVMFQGFSIRFYRVLSFCNVLHHGSR